MKKFLTLIPQIDTDFALSAKKKLACMFKALKFSRCKRLRNYSGLEHRLVNKLGQSFGKRKTNDRF